MGALSIALAYGIDVKSENDPNIHYAEEAVKGLAGAANFSAFLVNSIPLLKHVPSWFPGAKWKKKAEMWSDWTVKMREIPFQQSLEQLVSLSRFHCSSYPSFLAGYFGLMAIWLIYCSGWRNGDILIGHERHSGHWGDSRSRTSNDCHQRHCWQLLCWYECCQKSLSSRHIWHLFQGVLTQLYPLSVHSSWWWYAILRFKTRLRRNLIALSEKASCLITATRLRYLTSVLSWRKLSGTTSISDEIGILIHELFLGRFQAITPFGMSWFVERCLNTNTYLWQLFPII